ncbi:MAG TPA: c-type cytochrome [Planctomycetota bacterium]|jgi:mono/diheme cytochrome c family protein
MNRNKHLLLWSSLGVLTLLVIAWADENVFREWRRIQKATVSASGPIEVRLRQVSVPGLRANDRCVSCHVGMAPGEMGISGSKVVQEHPKVGHEPADFGCTVCHGGQGRATEKADAHGDVDFWPEPMIPAKYAYSGCGSCHTHLRVPDQTTLHRGRALVERYDCLACHRIDDRGGTLRPDGVSGMSGPDLSRTGAATCPPQWYEPHLKKSREANLTPRPPSLEGKGENGGTAGQGGAPASGSSGTESDTASRAWKTSFGEINPADRDVIDTYLASRVGAPRLVEGKSLFNSLGCRGCHKVGGVGGDDGPELTMSGQKDPAHLDFAHVAGEHTVANWHAAHLRTPATLVPGSKMPNFALSEPQIDQLTAYILSLRRSNYPEAYWPKDRVRAERLGEREFSTDGATLYGTFCAACHGASGEGKRYPNTPVFPAIGNPDFLSVASDEFIAATVRHGRTGRRMPAWGQKEGGLRPEEIQNVVAYLRTLGGTPPPAPDPKPARWVKGDFALGATLYGTHCATCHGSTGEAPPLSNKSLLANATDTYLVETISRGRRGTVMRAFAKPSTIYPAFTQHEIESVVTFLRTLEKQK